MAKTLDDGFNALISKLKPLQSEHDKALSHKDSVARCMEKSFKCTSLLETGSFGNGTGVRHFSDTDYFAICPDDQFWTNSSYTLTQVKEALQYTFPRTDNIVVKSPAVQIPFGDYKSETMEVTPATRNGLVSTPVGDKYSYDIPDYEGGWMKSSPGAHNAYVKEHNTRLNGKLKPLIQMVKAWKSYNSVPITSFYIELSVTKYAEGEKTIVYDADLVNIMKLLFENDLASIRDPMGISGLVPSSKTKAKREAALSKLKTGYTRAQKAFDNRDDPDTAFYWWNMFFNYEFPAR